MLARKVVSSWSMQFYPPAVGLDGEDKSACHPEIDEALFYNEFEEERYKLF